MPWRPAQPPHVNLRSLQGLHFCRTRQATSSFWICILRSRFICLSFMRVPALGALLAWWHSVRCPHQLTVHSVLGACGVQLLSPALFPRAVTLTRWGHGTSEVNGSRIPQHCATGRCRWVRPARLAPLGHVHGGRPGAARCSGAGREGPACGAGLKAKPRGSLAAGTWPPPQMAAFPRLLPAALLPPDSAV